MNQELKDFKKIALEIIALKTKKSKDYGNSWRIFGIDGIYYQIGNKFARLWKLKHKNPENESLIDTLKDLTIYTLMAIQLLESGQTEDKIEKLL